MLGSDPHSPGLILEHRRDIVAAHAVLRQWVVSVDVKFLSVWVVLIDEFTRATNREDVATGVVVAIDLVAEVIGRVNAVNEILEVGL